MIFFKARRNIFSLVLRLDFSASIFIASVFFITFLFNPVFINTSRAQDNAANIPNNSNSNKAVSFRGPNITKCNLLFSPLNSKGKNHLGEAFVLSPTGVDGFRESLRNQIKLKGPNWLQGAHLFHTGVEMGNENNILSQINQILEEFQVRHLVKKVHILSIPKDTYEKTVRGAAQKYYDHFKYWFPNHARDYEHPTPEQISSGILTSTLIEVPNFIMLGNTLNPLDAGVTIATHYLTLILYDVFKDSMANWLLRGKTSHTAKYVKQLTLSLPFVLNYSIATNLTETIQSIKDHGFMFQVDQFFWDGAIQFASTQSMTLFLQTMFYKIVIVDWINEWAATRAGRGLGEDSNQTSDRDIARVTANVIKLIPLAADAMFLAMAAGGGDALFTLGPLEFNVGHAGILGLTAIGLGAKKFFPTMLDPTIKWYRGFKNGTRGMQAWMKNKLGIDVRKVLKKNPKTK